jgi:hypothetical protein
MDGKNIKQDTMVNWDKLNEELDSTLDPIASEE